MKLAEALIERADLQKRVLQMSGRILNNLIVQDGESPAEHPTDLFDELNDMLARLEQLIKQINVTNITAKLEDGTTLTDALAKRDVLHQRINIIRSAIDGATGGRTNRYSLSEIKNSITIDVKHLREVLDEHSKQYRRLDTEIQGANWNTDLV